MAWSQRMKQALETRRLHGQYRQRQVNEYADARSLRVDGHDYRNFSANDYLGLSHDARIVAAWRTRLSLNGFSRVFSSRNHTCGPTAWCI